MTSQKSLEKPPVFGFPDRNAIKHKDVAIQTQATSRVNVDAA